MVRSVAGLHRQLLPLGLSPTGPDSAHEHTPKVSKGNTLGQSSAGSGGPAGARGGARSGGWGGDFEQVFAAMIDLKGRVIEAESLV